MLVAIDLQNGRDIAADSPQGAWLKKGILRYIKDERLSLDKSLGLAVCGSRHISTKIAQNLRNHYLIQAVRNISLNNELSDWARCVRLAAQANRLCHFWDTQKNISLDPGWESWKSHLFKAWDVGIGVPTTARGLYRVMENSIYSLHRDELRMYETVQSKRQYAKLVQNQSQG